jgi:ankyrin repeat protein
MIDLPTRLRRAIHLSDPSLCARILRASPSLLQNPDFSNKSNTSLHLAATHGSPEIVQLLITLGHDDGEISRNADHDTPLMLAAKAGHVQTAALLANQFPRSISFVNKAGLDVLALSAQTAASTALIPVLLEHPSFPANVHVRDLDGNTPLHHASASGALKALRLLLAAGADPLAKNNYDWTPLAYSQTVAAEVYMKNLVAEFARRKAEGAKVSEERERMRVGGVRLVGDDDMGTVDEDEVIGDVLKRHWSPTDRRRPGTPKGSYDWGSALGHARTRSGS